MRSGTWGGAAEKGPLRSDALDQAVDGIHRLSTCAVIVHSGPGWGHDMAGPFRSLRLVEGDRCVTVSQLQLQLIDTTHMCSTRLPIF